jgi:hypothetical protein
VTLEHGLSSDAVQQHRIRYGKNELPTDPGMYDNNNNKDVMVYIYSWLVCDGVGTPFWKLVLKQFDDLLVKVCCNHIVRVLYEEYDPCMGGCVV